MAESVDFIFERANSALITQDFQYAERLLTNVLKKHPDISPENKEKIESLLARIYGDEGDLERSMAAYLRLYARYPNNTDLMINLGRIYRHLARYEEALHILEKAQKIGGDTDEVLYNLAKTYKRMHNYEKAAEYFSRAIQIKPDHAHAYDRLGNLYSLTGETDKAIETYKNGLRMDPNHPYLNFHLAGLLQQEKRYEEAIVYYNTALRINPSWSEVLSGIASSYLQLDKLDDALNTYRSILRISGESAPIYTELGYLFEKKQLQQEAEQYFYDALVIEPDYAPAALALTRHLEKKRQYDEALPKLLAAEAASVNEDNHSLRLKAIQICMYAKDYAKARELFERLDENHRNDLNTLKLKGQLYALTGDVEKAEETFQKIVQTAPSAIEFRYELAEQYILAHKYEEAQQQLKLFLKQRPTDIPALMALAKTEEALNNPQAAYQVYQKILTLKSDSFEAHSALSRLFQRSGETIEALKTANEMLNMQSVSETVEQTQDLAETLDLYEQAAESYMADPQLMKNLDHLKSSAVPIYITQDELKRESAVSVPPSLRAVSKAEHELPFDVLIEEAEEIEDLPLADEDAEALQLIETAASTVPATPSPMNGETSSLPDQHAAAPNDTTAPQLQTASGTAPASPMQPPPAAGTDMPPQPETAPFAATLPLQAGMPTPLDQHTAAQADTTTPQPPHTQPLTQPLPQSTAPTDNGYVQLAGVPQPKVSPVYHTFDGMTFSSPVEDLYIKQQAQQKQFHLTAQPDPALDRMETLNAYGTSIEFLRDVISDIDQKLDEKRYGQAVEVLAEKIAENLSRKLPLQATGTQLLKQAAEAAVSAPVQQATDSTPEAAHPTADTDNALNPVQPETDDDALQTNQDKPEPPAQPAPLSETLEGFEDIDFEDFTSEEPEDISHEDSRAEDAEPIVNFTQEDEPPEPAAVADTFSLDQEQKNLLWCHAKHTVKDSPAFDAYLNSADPEKLVELFSYLRELFSFLPQAEREIFLNSSERVQIHYIIARLSGGIGLKERANIMRQIDNTIDTAPPYNQASILSLFQYLRDLSSSLADQELGIRMKQELEELIANVSSVQPDT